MLWEGLTKKRVHRLARQHFPDLDFRVVFSSDEMDYTGFSEEFAKKIKHDLENRRSAHAIMNRDRSYDYACFSPEKFPYEEEADNTILHELTHLAVYKYFGRGSKSEEAEKIGKKYGVSITDLGTLRLFGEAVCELYAVLGLVDDKFAQRWNAETTRLMGSRYRGAPLTRSDMRRRRIQGAAHFQILDTLYGLREHKTTDMHYLSTFILDAAAEDETLLATDKKGYELLEQIMEFVARHIQPIAALEDTYKEGEKRGLFQTAFDEVNRIPLANFRARDFKPDPPPVLRNDQPPTNAQKMGLRYYYALINHRTKEAMREQASRPQRRIIPGFVRDWGHALRRGLGRE